jgi:hypothetical protein
MFLFQTSVHAKKEEFSSDKIKKIEEISNRMKDLYTNKIMESASLKKPLPPNILNIKKELDSFIKNDSGKYSVAIKNDYDSNTPISAVLAIRLVLNSKASNELKDKALDLYNKIRPILVEQKIDNLPQPYPPKLTVPVRERYHFPSSDPRSVLNKLDISKYDAQVDSLLENLYKTDLAFLPREKIKETIEKSLLELEYIDKEGDLSKAYLASLKKMSLAPSSLVKYYAKICEYSEPVYKDLSTLMKAQIYKRLDGLIKNVNDSSLLSQGEYRGSSAYLDLRDDILDYKRSLEPTGQVKRLPLSSQAELLQEEKRNIELLVTRSIFEKTRHSNVIINIPKFDSRNTGYEIQNVIAPLPTLQPIDLTDISKEYYYSLYPIKTPTPNIFGDSMSLYTRKDDTAIDHALPGNQKYKMKPEQFLVAFGGGGDIETNKVENAYKNELNNLLLTGNLHLISDEAKSKLKYLINNEKLIPETILLNGIEYSLNKKNGKIQYIDDYPSYISKGKETETKTIVKLIEEGAVLKDNSKITIKDILNDEDYFDEVSKLESSLAGEEDYKTTQSPSERKDWVHTFDAEFVPIGKLNVEKAKYGFIIRDDVYNTKEENDYYAELLTHWLTNPNFENDQFLAIKGYKTEEGEAATYKLFHKDKDRLVEIRGADNTFLKQLTHAVADAHEVGLFQIQNNLQGGPNSDESNYFKRLVDNPSGGGFVSFNLPADSGLLFHVQSLKPVLKTKTDETGAKKYYEDTLIEGTISVQIKRNHKIDIIGNFYDPEAAEKLTGSGGFRYRYETGRDQASLTLLGGKHNTPIYNQEGELIENREGADILVKLIGKHKAGESSIVKYHLGYERGVYDYDTYLNTQESQKAYFDALNRIFVGSGYEYKTEGGGTVGGEFLLGFPFKDKEGFKKEEMLFKFMFRALSAHNNGFKITIGKHGAMDDMLREFSDTVTDLSNSKLTDDMANKRLDEFMKKYEDITNQLWYGTLDIIVEDNFYMTSNVRWIEGEQTPNNADLSLLGYLGEKGFITAYTDTSERYPYPVVNSLYENPSRQFTAGLGGGMFNIFRVDGWTTAMFQYSLTEEGYELQKPKWITGGRLVVGDPDVFVAHGIFSIGPDFFEDENQKKNNLYTGEFGFLSRLGNFDVTSSFLLTYKDDQYQNLSFMFGAKYNFTTRHAINVNVLLHDYVFQDTEGIKGSEITYSGSVGYLYKEPAGPSFDASIVFGGGPPVPPGLLPYEAIMNPASSTPFYFGAQLKFSLPELKKKKKE